MTRVTTLNLPTLPGMLILIAATVLSSVAYGFDYGIIAFVGDPAPGADGHEISGFDWAAIGPGGNAVFQSRSLQSATNERGPNLVCRWDGQSMTKIASLGQSLPGAPGFEIDRFFLDNSNLGPDGSFLLPAKLRSTSNPDDRQMGIWHVAADGTITSYLREGDPLPGRSETLYCPVPPEQHEYSWRVNTTPQGDRIIEADYRAAGDDTDLGTASTQDDVLLRSVGGGALETILMNNQTVVPDYGMINGYWGPKVVGGGSVYVDYGSGEDAIGFRAPVDGDRSILFRAGDRAVGFPETATIFSPDLDSANSRGDFTFSGAATWHEPGKPNISYGGDATWHVDSSGNTSLLAHRDQDAPGISGATLRSDTESLVMSDGRVLLYGKVDFGDYRGTALWIGDPATGQFSPIAYEGMPLPDGSGDRFKEVVGLDGDSMLLCNSKGDVVFGEVTDRFLRGMESLWHYDANTGELQPIFRPMDSIQVDGETWLTGFGISLLHRGESISNGEDGSRIFLNDDRQLIFAAGLRPPGPPPWPRSGDALMIVQLPEPATLMVMAAAVVGLARRTGRR